MPQEELQTESVQIYRPLFNEFLSGSDTLQVYKDEKLLFSSNKDRVLPLLEYIDGFTPHHQQVIIFDKIMGNAAALLAVKANCQEVYSPLGSQLAIKTLDRYGIKHHISEIVPCIQKANSQDICPMEKLSMDKEPEDFYEAIKKQSTGVT